MNNSTSHPLSSEDLLAIVQKVLADHNGQDILVINLKNKTSLADYMVIASGTSQRHLYSLSNFIEEEAKKASHKFVHREGDQNSEWILVYLGSVIVHLFRPDSRTYYNMENLWENKETTQPESLQSLAVDKKYKS